MRYFIALFLLLGTVFGYGQDSTHAYVLVLGVAQDGGYPHAGCMKKCCAMAQEDKKLARYVVSLALVDPVSKKWWLFEATPDIREQLQYFRNLTGAKYNYLPDGIFITHAHIGHYTGLMQLGKEVMATQNVPVYTLPKLRAFLETNGPWSQLVQQKNIELRELQPEVKGIGNTAVTITEGIAVQAFTVPHRDEYSETAGFRIATPGKAYLFIPDIDKWKKWDRDIVVEVRQSDVALLDATFYENGELPGRDMSEVPHPFVLETVKLFQLKNIPTRAKIHFIHMNHTNPLLWDGQKQADVKLGGFNIAEQGQRL